MIVPLGRVISLIEWMLNAKSLCRSLKDSLELRCGNSVVVLHSLSNSVSSS